MRAGAMAAAGLIGVGLLSLPAASLVSASAAPTQFRAVGHAPKVPADAKRIGTATSSEQISGAVALAPRDPAALAAAATAVADPHSASYHHYLAKGAFKQAYGPTASTIDAVRSTLTKSHLKVTSVSSNGLLVNFTGTVGSADSAFRTKIANYRLANGRVGTQTTTPVSFPASIASQVTSVIGLDTLAAPSTTNLEHATHPAKVKAIAPHLTHYSGAPDSCADSSGAASVNGGLTDDQIAHAYGVDQLYKNGDTGANQSIAVFELEPFRSTDLATFDQCYYGKTAATAMANRLHVIDVDGGAGTGGGSGESILDVEDVSGLAPSANIDVYEAPNTTAGSLDEYNQIVQTDSDQLLTTSWGDCETDEVNLEPGYINVENDVFQQAALQGQTVLAAAGDAGSDGCAYQSPVPAAPTLSTGDPGTQPYVTAVGGTTITNATTSSTAGPTEQVWNDGSSGGAGSGGISAVWGAPSWQQPFLDTAAAAAAVTTGHQKVCPQSPSDGALCHEDPDVSAQADEYTGAITVYDVDFGWTTFGGTSSSTPLWAAMLADVNASTTCASSSRVGFVSPSLYAIAAIPSEYKASFNDITVGDNDEYDQFNGAFYKAHTGYDMATGLGTPIIAGPSGQAGLAVDLCAIAASTAPTRPVVSGLSPASVTATPTGSLTISGTGFTAGSAVSIGSYAVPAADVSFTDSSTLVVSPIPSASLANTGGVGPQDGTGRAIVSVTNSSGASSPLTSNGTLIYLDGTTTSSSVPSVAAVSPYGGGDTGGNTVTIYGSGFTSATVTGVTFGSVPATSFDVVTNDQLTAVVPALSGSTVCAAGDDASTDVCQTQVVVSNANGSSATSTILPPYSGAPFEGASAGVPEPDAIKNGTQEFVAADTEYDYLATPTIDSITTTSANDATTWASEDGSTLATIKGKGFDVLGYEWTNIGDPTVNANQDLQLVYTSPTKIQVQINPHAESSEPIVKPLTVQTLAGKSAAVSISYAGVPTVSAVNPRTAPDTGGKAITITGKGFEGVRAADGGALIYGYEDAPASTNQLSGYRTTSDTEIQATTPQTNPGAFIVLVCTVTGCSGPTSEKSFEDSMIDFYQPGDPKVTGVVSPKTGKPISTGPAAGGTAVEIQGVNLADAVEVDFGKVVAEASNAPELLSNGSSTEIETTVPPGKAGTKVNIVVKTVESESGGHPSAVTSSGTWTYTSSVPAPPQDVTGKAHATTVDVTWKTPLSDGGHAIKYYRLIAKSIPTSSKKGAAHPKTIVVKTKNAKARSGAIKNLAAGWEWQISVEAVSSKGNGLPGLTDTTFFIRDKS